MIHSTLFSTRSKFTRQNQLARMIERSLWLYLRPQQREIVGDLEFASYDTLRPRSNHRHDLFLLLPFASVDDDSHVSLDVVISRKR